jgi:hypothetical protein
MGDKDRAAVCSMGRSNSGTTDLVDHQQAVTPDECAASYYLIS